MGGNKEVMTEAEEIFFTYYVEYINNRLRRFFVKIIVMFAFLGLTCGVLGYYVAKVSAENKKGLCAVKGENIKRVALGVQFLQENPNGIPGISVDSLKRSTRNAQQTVDALSSVSCSDAELKIDSKAGSTP